MSVYSLQNTRNPLGQEIWIGSPEVDPQEPNDLPKLETTERTNSVFFSKVYQSNRENTPVDLSKNVVILENGETFEGSLLHGRPHGYGTIIYKEGQISGNFDSKTGLDLTKPVQIKRNGDVFEGFVTSINDMQGNGTLTYANGDWIQGDFDNKRHRGIGRGTLTLAEGIKFYGLIRDGRAHGLGTMHFGEKVANERGMSSVTGQFIASTGLDLTKSVTIIYLDKTLFTGIISENGIEGEGTMRFLNGDWIEGRFRNREHVGRGNGCLTDAKGYQFEGTVLNGCPFEKGKKMFCSSEGSRLLDSPIHSEEEQIENQDFLVNEGWSPNLEVEDSIILN